MTVAAPVTHTRIKRTLKFQINIRMSKLSARGSLFTSSSRRTISSQEAVKMISQHHMPAADPKTELLDEPQVKAIQTKINNKPKPFHAGAHARTGIAPSPSRPSRAERAPPIAR